MVYIQRNGSYSTAYDDILHRDAISPSDFGWLFPYSPVFVGGSGSDTYTGLQGYDIILGQNGNDTLSGGDADDTIIGGGGFNELRGDNGNDFLSGGNHGNLLKGGFGNDRLYGGSATDKLDGGWGNDDLQGGAGNDKLYGGIGNDRLIGGLGRDILKDDDEGFGQDTFVFNTALGNNNVDDIQGFTHGTDRIALSKFVFSALHGAAGQTLRSDEFKIGTAATDANDHVIFNKATGNLYYDPDGVGGRSAVQFAHLDLSYSAAKNLSYHDFYLI